MTSVCVCGGGHIGHAAAGYFAANPDFKVSLLTRQPEKWAGMVECTLPGGGVATGRLQSVSDSPADTIPGADIVLLCLPGFAIEEVLRDIRPWLGSGTAVGSVMCSTGFFFIAHETLPEGQPLFGFRRTPFIARTLEYGRRVAIQGFKKVLHMAVENHPDPERLALTLAKATGTPVELLPGIYEASLSNGNPLLHTSRLYTLWGGHKPGTAYGSVPMFYEDWTDEASAKLVEMDRELHLLMRSLPMDPESLPTILDYYESADIGALTRKISSIPAFKGIKSPMVAVPGGFAPDFRNRYFAEDFPYGLDIVARIAKEHSVDTPTIREVDNWGMAVVGKRMEQQP